MSPDLARLIADAKLWAKSEPSARSNAEAFRICYELANANDEPLTETPMPTTKATHTPGPWYVTGSAPEGSVFGGPDHRLIVPAIDDDDERPKDWNGSEDWANRRLIASAPELLAALEAFSNAYPPAKEHLLGNGAARRHLTNARAAIALARGTKGPEADDGGANETPTSNSDGAGYAPSYLSAMRDSGRM